MYISKICVHNQATVNISFDGFLLGFFQHQEIIFAALHSASARNSVDSYSGIYMPLSIYYAKLESAYYFVAFVVFCSYSSSYG